MSSPRTKQNVWTSSLVGFTTNLIYLHPSSIPNPTALKKFKTAKLEEIYNQIVRIIVHHNESQSNTEQSTEDNLIASVKADIENNDDSLPGSKDKPPPRKLTYNPHHKYQTQRSSKKTTSSESLFSSSMTPRVPLSLSKHRRGEIICRFFCVNAEDMTSLCVKNAVGTAT